MPTPSAPNPQIPVPAAPLIGELNATKPQKRSWLNKVIGDHPTGERYSPQDLQNVAEQYLSTIGLGKDVTFGANAFEQHIQSRVKDYNGLQKAKIAEGDKPIFQKLNANVTDENQKLAIAAVKVEINDALQLTLKPDTGDTPAEEKFTKLEIAEKNYAELVQAFKELVKNVSGKRNVQDVIGVMEEIVNDGKKAIQKQQSEEIDRLNQKFDVPDFKKNLKTALNITDAQIEDVHKSFISDLEETHKKQLEAFDKSTQESLKALHSASEKQRQAFLFIASLHKNDEKMRREIERIASENQNPNTDQQLEVNVSDDKTSIHSVNLDQLKFIQLLGGEKINKMDGPPVSYKLDLGMKFASPRYYLNDRQERDMLLMAQAVRASGSSGITMTLKFKDEKVAEARARQAFEACIKAGFPPEKIKLNVNGRLMAYKATDGKDGQKYESVQEKLYAKKGNEFAFLLEQSQKIRQDLEAITKTPAQKSATGMDTIKKEMNTLRNAARERAAQTTPEEGNRTGITMR